MSVAVVGVDRPTVVNFVEKLLKEKPTAKPRKNIDKLKKVK
jgi:hypothetical protein